MTVSQYDHVVPYTDLGGRGYFGVNAALVAVDFIVETWKYVLIYVISQNWDGTGSLRCLHMEDKGVPALHIQYHGCWYPGYFCHQGISSHGTVFSILDLTPGFNGLCKDNCKMRQETLKFLDLMHITYTCCGYHIWTFLFMILYTQKRT